MQKIDDFDWDYLYAKAEEYIKEFIPEAHVNHGTMTLHGANPIVDVSFPEKGNKKVIKYLLEQKCIQYRRGTNTKGTRIRNLGIIFSEDERPCIQENGKEFVLNKEKNERINWINLDTMTCNIDAFYHEKKAHLCKKKEFPSDIKKSEL